MATIFKQTKHIVLNSILLTFSVYLTIAQDTLPKCTAIDSVNNASFGNGFNQISEGTTIFNFGGACSSLPDYGNGCAGFTTTGYLYGYHDLSNYENNRFMFDSVATSIDRLAVREYVTVSYDCVGTLQSPATWIPLTVYSETQSDLDPNIMLNRTFILPAICDNNANVGVRIDHPITTQFTLIKNMCINGEKTPTSAPTLAPSSNPSSNPTISVSESPYESGQSEDDSNSFSESGDRKKRKKRKKRGGSGSGSGSGSESADEALFAAHSDNEQMENNNEYILSLGFSNFSLINIWLLFGVSVAINITVCCLCHKKTEIKPVRDDSTIDF